MIEWQTEAGLFTVRIRGKQWYWVYKFELKSVTDILAAPKNIGRNKWRIYTPGDVQTANDYLHILQLRSQNKWIKKYWEKYLVDAGKVQNYHISSPQEQLRVDFSRNIENLYLENAISNRTSYITMYDLELDLVDSLPSDKHTLLYGSSHTNYFVRSKNKKITWSDLESIGQKHLLEMPVVSDAFLNSKKRTLLSDALDLDRAEQVSDNSAIYKHILSGFKTSYKNNDTVYGYNDFTNISRWLKRSQGTPAPVRFLKLPITSETTDLFDIRFYTSESTVQPKPTPHTTFLTMKQKRYARKKTIFPRTIYYRDELGKKSKRVKMSGNLLLYNNELIMSNFGDANKQYRFFRKNKKRYENTSVLLSRRLLRTRRTLVLPAHVNLTAVTNSYDVIHSWFIPGLGLKLDCIPGRATHHTFYIDNVGFYYGQCAEICGRYHHHMPIRICALPFEHFLVWWHSFGLPKLISTRPKKRYETYYAARKYVW